MAPNLEHCPAEVQVLLLCHLDSVTTLFRLLRASPGLLQVYQMNRNLVYSRVVRNHISADFLPTAIAVLRTRNIDREDDSGGNEECKASTFAEILQPASNWSDISLAEWKWLYRLQRTIEEMVQDAAQRSLEHLRVDVPSINHLHPNLSETEHYRMMRGFYNRELLASIYRFHLPAKIVSENRDEGDTQNDIDCSECIDSRLGCWALYEFEEVYFVIDYLRERLIQFRDQAEADRLEEWEAHGPYTGRYVFTELSQMVWSDVARTNIQTRWLWSLLFGAHSVSIDQIITEPEPVARIRHLEALRWIFLYQKEYWKPIATKLDQLRDQTASSMLISPLLPDDWRSCALPELDWDSQDFNEIIDGPNLGLLWGCRTSDGAQSQRRPDFALLDKMIHWGAMMWDSTRLKKAAIFGRHPGDVGGRTRKARPGDPRRIDKGNESVEVRAWKVERKWVSDGLMDGSWCGGPQHPYCSSCSAEARGLYKQPPQYPVLLTSLVVPAKVIKGRVICVNCAGE